MRRNENKEDANLGFIIRCTVADMIALIESKNKVITLMPKEIHLDHLQSDYIATVKVTIRKKDRA